MKIVPIVAMALALAACGTVPPGSGDVVNAIKRTITLTAGSAYLACSAVTTAHSSGKLTGVAFNKAKADCIAVDQLVDASAAALAAGDQAAAMTRINDAQTAIVNVQSETPKS